MKFKKDFPEIIGKLEADQLIASKLEKIESLLEKNNITINDLNLVEDMFLGLNDEEKDTKSYEALVNKRDNIIKYLLIEGSKLLNNEDLSVNDLGLVKNLLWI